jgi:hypothetical protein
MNKKDLLNILFKKTSLGKKEFKINSRISYLDDKNIVFILSEDTNIVLNDDFYLIKFEIEKFIRMIGFRIEEITFIVFDSKSTGILNKLFPNNKIMFVYDKSNTKQEIETVKNINNNVILKYVNDKKFFKLPNYIVLVDLDEHYLKRTFELYNDKIVVLKLRTGIEVNHKKINFNKVSVYNPGWVYDPTSGLWIHSYGWDGIEIIKGY